MDDFEEFRVELPESGPALYMCYLLLPVQRHDEDTYEAVYTVPMILSRN